MTLEQYSDLQRKLGYLEGLGYTIPDDLKTDYYDTIDYIDKILNDIMNEKTSQK